MKAPEGNAIQEDGELALGPRSTEDILFSGFSAATDSVAGYSVSGQTNWKNALGVSLNELEAQTIT